MSSPETFLHHRNTNLHNTPEVNQIVGYLRQGGEHIPNNPESKLHAYLGFLAEKDYPVGGILSGQEQDIEAELSRHVVRAREISPSYFDLQVRILREQGFGDVVLTPDMRQQLTEIVQETQHDSLKEWSNYLTSDDATYPDWFKFYTFEAVCRMAEFDLTSQSFRRRSTGTAAQFPELNPEALSATYDAIHKTHIIGEEDSASEPTIKKLVDSANFSKIYSHYFAVTRTNNLESRQNTNGTWVKFDQGDNPEETAQRLAASLMGKGTSWCTATGRTAFIQLRGGDFYVYYTQDKEGDFTNPRIAIRMYSHGIAELRGIEKGQNLEPDMYEIAHKKAVSLPGGERYQQKREDMEAVTEIDRKTEAGLPLSAQELFFIYEYERPIEGFGISADPRVARIIANRDSASDLKTLFNFHGYEAFKSRLKQLDRIQDLYRHPEAVEEMGISHDHLAQEVIQTYGINYFLRIARNYQLKEITDDMLFDLAYTEKNTLSMQYGGLDLFTYVFARAEGKKARMAVLKKARKYGGLPIITQSAGEFEFTKPELGFIFDSLLEKEDSYSVACNFKTFLPLFPNMQAYHDALMEKGGGRVILDKLGHRFKNINVDFTAIAKQIAESHKHESQWSDQRSAGYFKKIIRVLGDEPVIKLLMEYEQPGILLSLAKSYGTKFKDKLDKSAIIKLLAEHQDFEGLATCFSIDEIPAEYHKSVFEQHLGKVQAMPYFSSRMLGVIQNLGKYDSTAVDYRKLYELALSAHDNSCLEALVRHLDKFPPECVDFSEVSKTALERGSYEVLAHHIDKFPVGAVDVELLTHKLQANNQNQLVIRKLGKHIIGQSADTSTTTKTLREAFALGEEYIRNNLKSLIKACTPELVAERLISQGLVYVVEDQINVFLSNTTDRAKFIDTIEELGLAEVAINLRKPKEEEPELETSPVELIDLEDPELFIEDEFASLQEY